MIFYRSEIQVSFWLYTKFYFQARGNSVVLGWKWFPEDTGGKGFLEENDDSPGIRAGLTNECYKGLLKGKTNNKTQKTKPSGDHQMQLKLLQTLIQIYHWDHIRVTEHYKISYCWC